MFKKAPTQEPFAFIQITVYLFNMKLVSIKDIAIKAGVSTTTVSFVLNGKAREKRISEELEKNIISIADKLHYRPNPLARGLRTGQTETIALMVEDIANPFFAALARVIEDEADKLGYTVMFSSTENDENRALKLIHGLKHRQMDGFLITPTRGMKETILQLKKEEREVILIDRYIPDIDISSVTVNNIKGAEIATHYLIKKGFKRIAMVTTLVEQVQMQERLQGYKSTLQKFGFEDQPELVLEIPFNNPKEEAIQAIERFCKQQHPDAIFFATNYLGVYGLETWRESGAYSNGIVCFDDTDLFRLGKPAITVVAQPVEYIAREAINLLVSNIRNERAREVEHIRIDPQLIIRET